MKKLLSIFLSLVLTFCCIASLIPAGFLTVHAAEPEGEVITDTIPFQVNPVYEGIIDPSTFGIETCPATPKTYGTSDYVSFTEGAAMMRDTMVERGAYLDINYTTTDSDVRQSLHDLTDVAFTHNGNPIQGDYLRYTYGGWSCSYSYYYSGGTYYVSASFSIAYYTTAAQEAAMDSAVDSLLNQLDLWDNTDYQKLYGIYDYIATNVRYDYDHLGDSDYLLQYTGYAALCHKTAVCQGYANLFYRLALELDVDARIVSGIGNGGPHAWNIAKLDGKYYNLDSTWDEGSWYYSWFLLSNDSFTNHSREDRFLTTAFDNAYPMSETDYVYDSVKSNIQIDTQPKSVTVASGKTAKVTVEARGEGLTYQWYIKDPGSSSYSKSSITGPSYSVVISSTRSGRNVYCLITDAYGNQLKTNTVTLTILPSGITVSKNTYNSLTVTWDKIDKAEYYELYRSTKPSSGFVKLGTFNSTTFSRVSSNLSTGTTYYYKVRGYYVLDGYKKYVEDSDIASGTPTLSAPSGVTVSKNTYNTLKVSWNKVTGATYYQVYRSVQGANEWKLLGVYDENTTSMTSRSLSTGTTYEYRVRCYRWANSERQFSSWSTIKSGTPTMTAPTGVKATTGSTTGTVTVSWSKTAGATYYQVYRSATGTSDWKLLGTYDENTTSMTSKALVSGTTYYYRVRCYRWAGGERQFSSWSTVVNAVAK